MKIAILAPGYPTNNMSGWTFVHARAKLYLHENEVAIFTPSTNTKLRNFENVNVTQGTSKTLISSIKNYQPDILCVHFPDISILRIAMKLHHIPQIAWIHGHEILWSTKINKTKSLLRNLIKRLLIVPRLLIQSRIQIVYFKKISKIVFVSQWMKEEAEKHSGLRFKNSVIIPNPIDTDLFKFAPPSAKKINKAVSLRSLTNKKYGLDIAIKAFSQEDRCSLEIYGYGNLYSEYLKLSKNQKSNTKLHHVSIKHNDVPGLYSKFGFFVAPSRIEAQGVAMCEAMSCGLPVISTTVGGIPEFVRDGIDGYLVEPENPKAIKNAISLLLKDYDNYTKMCKNARENVLNICSGSVILKREISLMKDVINQNSL